MPALERLGCSSVCAKFACIGLGSPITPYNQTPLKYSFAGIYIAAACLYRLEY